MSRKQAGDMNLGLEVGKGFIAKIIMAAFGFAGTIIFARVLGPTSFGGFYLLLSLVELSKRPVIGVGDAVKKRYAEANAPRQELVGVQLVFVLGMLLVAAVFVFVLSGPLVSYTGLQTAPALFLLLFAAVASFPIYQNLLTSIGNLGVETWIDTVRSVVTFVAQLLFVLAGYGAAGMAYGLSLGTFLLLPVTHYYLRTLPTAPSTDTLHSVWSFARYSTPSAIVGKAYDRFDILLLGALASPAVAGQYEVAYKLTVPAMFIAGLSGSGLMAKVSNLDSQGKDTSRAISNTLAFSSLLSIPLFFGALAIAERTVVTIYGPEYKSAAALLVGLALYRVLATQSGILVNAINGLNTPKDQLVASTISLLVNIPLGVGLYYQIGALGVVVATVIAESLRYAILYQKIRGQTDATLIPRALIEQIVAGATMFVAVDAAAQFVAVQSWVEFSGLVAVGGAVYFGVLLALSRHFRITIQSVFRQALA